MKFQFKIQEYQTRAVRAVADCFVGQRRRTPLGAGANEPLQLTATELLQNIQQVQSQQALPRSERLVGSRASALNLDVEMETGTGKTYCYIKTMFELQQRFGWNKYVVVVPSIAIREGVQQSFRITTDHFLGQYGHRARTFTYSAAQLHHLGSFASDAALQVMIINVQAFNAFQSGAALAAARVIFSQRDEFQSRRPIDVLKATRPILILDEPQRMGGERTSRALAEFDPLMTLRYSATHRVQHNQVFRLDAGEAYQQKLVKKIAVRGFTATTSENATGYLHLEAIQVAKDRAPAAIVEWEQNTANGVRRVRRTVKRGSDLFTASQGLEVYRGWVVTDIDARGEGLVEFSNGQRLSPGGTHGVSSDDTLRRLQIREAIKAHLEKETQLFAQGIKVLTLFFIDSVANYRCYDHAGRPVDGRYAEMFESEYAMVLAEHRLGIDDPAYQQYVEGIDAARTHRGYFSIDRPTQRLVDPRVRRSGEMRGESEDVSAYELILKDKERLLSFDEPTRFLFTHSALREGWDNPNVFVIGMLKATDYEGSQLTRRQEVGRGLRICVDQQGRRVDDPCIVHDVNVLTVVANESFESFVTNLQREIRGSLSAPRRGGGLHASDCVALPQPVNGRQSQDQRPPRTTVHEPCGICVDSHQLVQRCVEALERELCGGPRRWVMQQGQQTSGGDDEPTTGPTRWDLQEATTAVVAAAAVRGVRYDLVGRIESETLLTRQTIVDILRGLSAETFAVFRYSPEAFIAGVTGVIGQQLAMLSVRRASHPDPD